MNAKRLLALLLAAMLVLGVLSACGGGNENSESGGTSGGASETQSEEESKAESAGGESSETGEVSSTGGETNANGYPASDVVMGKTNQQTYPLVSEPLTLDLWYPMAGSMGELADFNDGEFWPWYEEKTGIHINFIVPAAGTESEAFSLLFASDDLPDMAYSQPYSGQSYRDGEDAAIEDGYFIDMMEYLDFAPNYVSWLNSQEDFGKSAKSDTGKMYGMWGVWLTMGDECVADQGIAIRQDFLDKVGMEVPTTYDEWEEVLTAFKDQLGIEAPFYTSKYGIDYGEFMAGYDTAPYWYMRDGKVQYGPMDDQYRDYLTLLHDWWEKGLLDKDFATRQSTGITADNDMMLNDKVGALIDYGTRMGGTYVTRGATNPDFFLVAAPQPVKSGDDAVTPSFRNASAGSDHMNGYCMVFFADGENIEEAIRWNDGFYAEDVYLNANYGLESEEDVVWYAAEDGHRIGDYDFRYSNPDGISSATVLVQFWTKNPPVRYEASQIEQMEDYLQENYQVWSENEPTSFLPVRMTMTSDENSEYASMYSDIETFVQEANAQFIMGQKSLDEYDDYRQSLVDMGIEDCIALQQAALDRYYAR